MRFTDKLAATAAPFLVFSVLSSILRSWLATLEMASLEELKILVVSPAKAFTKPSSVPFVSEVEEESPEELPGVEVPEPPEVPGISSA